MDLNLAQCLAIKLMDEHDLIFRGWTFEFDNAKRRFGCCRYRTKKITLSKHLVKLNDESIVRNTILHEIAHALVGAGHGHNHVWRTKAIALGCNGERCYSSDKVNLPEYKYLGLCVNGHTHNRHRKPRQSVSCGRCSAKYNAKYIIKWTKNL